MFQYLSRFKFVKQVSIAAIIVFIGFGILRIHKGALFFGLIDFSIVMILALNLLFLLKKGKLELASHVLIFFLVFFSLLLYVSGGIDSTGNIPLLSLPLFIYFMFEKKHANSWMLLHALLFSTMTGLLLANIIPDPYSEGVVRQTIIFYFLIVWVSYLFESLNYKSQMQIKKQAESLKAYNHELICAIEEKTKAIGDIHDTIEDTIASEVRRKKTKDQIFFQQSKQKQIAEMLTMVSDQWREPLSYIASIIQNTRQVMSSEEKLSINFIEDSLGSVDSALKELAEIIESFHTFYQPNTEKEYFFIHLSIKDCLVMMEKSLKLANIHLNIWLDDGLEVVGFKSEFEQVIVNLLSNAKRELMKKNIEDPWIEIIVKEELIDSIPFAVIIVRDNGLGIKEDYLNMIFSSTIQSQSLDGSNIGLYMSKEIIESHMHGTITAENYEEKVGETVRVGAKFEITLPLVKHNR